MPIPSWCIASMNALRVVPRRSSGSSTVNMFQLWPGLSRGGRRSGVSEVVALEAREVVRGEALARAAPRVEVRQLREPEARRDIREVVLAARRARRRACRRRAGAMPWKRSCSTRARLARVVHHQRAALDGGHVLVRVEAEGDEVAGGAHGLAARARADRERRVLEDAHAVALAERGERGGIERRVVVRGQQHARARRDGRARPARGRGCGSQVHVHEHRRGAAALDHVGGGEEALRGRDHLVAGADAEHLERDLHRRGGRGEGADGAPAEALARAPARRPRPAGRSRSSGCAASRRRRRSSPRRSSGARTAGRSSVTSAPPGRRRPR